MTIPSGDPRAFGHQQAPTPPPVAEPAPIAGVIRRALAKMIDFTGVAFIIVGVSRMSGSYLVGLLSGYAWLAISDWGSSLGKCIMRLEVRDDATGHECTAYASVIRNLPIIVIAMPARLHQALLGMERHEYLHSYRVLFLVLTFAGLVALLAIVIDAFDRNNGRHFGDRMAGTIVLARKKQRPQK